MNILIPRGFRKIAVSQFGMREVSAWSHPDSGEIIFEAVDEFGNSQILGPIRPGMLPVWIHCLTDVDHMKGSHVYIEETG
jgi:hypothetical protein